MGGERAARAPRAFGSWRNVRRLLLRLDDAANDGNGSTRPNCRGVAAATPPDDFRDWRPVYPRRAGLHFAARRARARQAFRRGESALHGAARVECGGRLGTAGTSTRSPTGGCLGDNSARLAHCLGAAVLDAPGSAE